MADILDDLRRYAAWARSYADYQVTLNSKGERVPREPRDPLLDHRAETLERAVAEIERLRAANQ
jgi:hypothetical protein